MESVDERLARRLRRLAEEIGDELSAHVADVVDDEAVIREVAAALWTPRHERRVPTYGAIVGSGVPIARWCAATGLIVTHDDVGFGPLDSARRFADGLASWLVVDDAQPVHLVVFDRPVSSERDLVVLASASDGIVVQRHPNGIVRVVGAFGVIRTDGLAWQLEPPVDMWLDQTCRQRPGVVDGVLKAAIEFAVHDLGAAGIGTTLVFHPDPDSIAHAYDGRRSLVAPSLLITRSTDLAPLRHALAHLDGAAIFDGTGALRILGAHLTPSRDAQTSVAPFPGTRHTSARRFSHDHPTALVITVSDDGPVTVFDAGAVRASSGHERS